MSYQKEYQRNTKKPKTPLGQKIENIFATLLMTCVFIGFIIYGSDIGIQIIGAFFVIFFAFPILRIPRSITVTPERIVIKQFIGEKVFERAEYDIRAIRLDPDRTFYATRWWSSPSWVKWGYYSWGEIGMFFAQHVGDKDLLLLTRKRDGKKYVIDNPK